MDILAVQTALQAQGFNPGEVDGVWGRRSISALKAFQKVRGLKVDGVIGPQTIQALKEGSAMVGMGVPLSVGVPIVWHEQAVSLVGTKELAGTGSNVRILDWARKLDIDYKDDDIPWCGLFVAHCIGSTLPDEPLPKGPLMARNWRSFGDSTSPMVGAILVFWRGSREGGQGHVGFYKSEDGEAYHVLGGNQSNAVNVARISKSRLLAARWPRTAASLTGSVVMAEADAPLSHSEA